jgi:hypothetical protein
MSDYGSDEEPKSFNSRGSPLPPRTQSILRKPSIGSASPRSQKSVSICEDVSPISRKARLKQQLQETGLKPEERKSEIMMEYTLAESKEKKEDKSEESASKESTTTCRGCRLL